MAQRPLWWFAQLTPDRPIYNEIVHFTKSGPLDLVALEGAFNELICRHEAWRTTFDTVDGEPVQIVHPTAAVSIPLVDLSGLAPAKATQAALRHAVELARPAFDLATGPLLRPLILTLAPDEHRLYLAIHHLIFDGVSLYRTVLPELAALYAAQVSGVAAELPAAARYRDFVAWEQAEVDSPRFADNVEFHRRRLVGSTTMNLPIDRPRPVRQQFRGGLEPLHIPASVVDGLKNIADATSATLYQVLAAAYSVFLSRFAGQEDVVFGTATDLRRRRDLVSVVGMCVSSAVLRVRLHDEPSFVDLVERVRDELADVLERHVPFDVLVRELESGRDQRMHPLFQVGFVLEPPLPPADQDWGLALVEVELGDGLQVAKFDLHLELDERIDGHLSGRFNFNTDLFDRATAQRMVQAFTLLLESVALDPKRPVSELAVLSDAQLRELLVDWNDTSPKASGDESRISPQPQTLSGALEAAASANPEAVAVRFEGAGLTYRQLHETANALAERLIAAGAGPGSLVGIGSERSLEMLVGMLAVLKSGAAYVPLDPALPASRLRYMVEDAAPSVLLLDAGMAENVADLVAPVNAVEAAPAVEVSLAHVVQLDGCLDARWPKPPVLERPTAPEDPAYVIYTSGSTGRPKGVVVPHRAAVSMLAAYRIAPGFPSGARLLALATISFDIAAAEIWLPLTSGERCTLASRADAVDPARLAKLLREERITHLQGTPSTFGALLDDGWKGDPELTAWCGGEHLSREFADHLIRRCKALWNLYGPTETTVFSTVGRVTPQEAITIGRPISGTRIYLLDGRGRPVPVGVAGELVIAGAGVSSGYLNRPELTAERFVPELNRPQERMYRSGDLARYLPDGRIELLGRLDEQVKIRGHRVELGEIESVVLASSGAAAVVVVLRDVSPGDQRLVAYLVPEAGAPALVPGELRAALQGLLAGYMIPSAFVTLDALPVTPSGKVDRAALPAPQSGDLARGSSGSGPATPLEAQLAQIWARLLGLESVAPEDDFFELGGHSLLAVRLVAAIEQELGRPLSVSMLINGEATVRGLASRLSAASSEPADRARQPGSWTPEIVRLNPDGDLAPLIMFIPSRESLLALRHLRSSFDERQPVIGLLVGLDERARFPRGATVASIARESLPIVRELAAGQPFRIAGYSMAGLIAYEVTGLLRADGAEVSWFGLVDTYSPRLVLRELSIGLYLERSRQRAWRASLASAMAHIRTESVVYGVDLLARIRRRPLDRFDELGARRVISGYTPAGHDVPLHLLMTSESTEKAAPMLGWSELHPGQVVLHHVDGDHLSIMQSDAAHRLGKTLTEALATSV
jgi:amino acid adenylation domain-containing protein